MRAGAARSAPEKFLAARLSRRSCQFRLESPYARQLLQRQVRVDSSLIGERTLAHAQPRAAHPLDCVRLRGERTRVKLGTLRKKCIHRWVDT